MKKSKTKSFLQLWTVGYCLLMMFANRATGYQAAIDEDHTHTQLGENIGREMSKLKDIGFTGCVLIAHKGEVILVHSYGFADLEKKTLLKPNSLFELGSLTKPFTATAAMILVQQGPLDLDVPISNYLPAVPGNCQKITVRHLLQHTSGISGDNYGTTSAGLETAVKTMLAGGPRHEPGTRHEYWNQGYILLSEIIAKAAGEPYVDVCKSLIFEPAEMEGTCFTGDELPGGYTTTVGTGKMGPLRSCLDHPYGSYGLNYRGCGGIVSSVHDLWKFHCALRDNTLLDETHTAKMFDEGDMQYALGWRIVKTTGQQAAQMHTGKVRGFLCDFRRYPESDSCIVVLSNDDTNPVSSIAGVMERFLFAPTMPDRLDDDLANKYVGKFTDAKGRRLVIVQEQGQLTYAIHWGAAGAPVSRGYVLKDESGKVVLYQPGDVSEIESKLVDGGTSVQSISFMNLTFNRTTE